MKSQYAHSRYLLFQTYFSSLGVILSSCGGIFESSNCRIVSYAHHSVANSMSLGDRLYGSCCQEIRLLTSNRDDHSMAMINSQLFEARSKCTQSSLKSIRWSWKWHWENSGSVWIQLVMLNVQSDKCCWLISEAMRIFLISCTGWTNNDDLSTPIFLISMVSNWDPSGSEYVDLHEIKDA